jgi:flagellar biogenesis protein FliO
MLLKAKMIWSYINYRASLFLDNYDMNKQDTLSKSLNITKKMFYLLGIALVIIFCLLYFLKRTIKKPKKLLVDRLFDKYLKKLNRSILATDSLIEIKEKVGDQPHVIEVINQYETIKYAGKSDNKNIRRFKQLLKKNTTNKI